jgi:hypothetical protein
VLAKPTESCTHIVYKSGKTSTVAWYRRQEDPKPYLVGISWVTRSKEAGKRIDEEAYEINLEEIETFKKVRRWRVSSRGRQADMDFMPCIGRDDVRWNLNNFARSLPPVTDKNLSKLVSGDDLFEAYRLELR